MLIYSDIQLYSILVKYPNSNNLRPHTFKTRENKFWIIKEDQKSVKGDKFVYYVSTVNIWNHHINVCLHNVI